MLASEQETVSAETSTVVSADPICGGEAALLGEPDAAQSRMLLYAVRDEVLPTLPDGRWLRETYYRHAPEVARLLLLDRALRQEAQSVFRQLRPVLETATAGAALQLPASDRLAIKGFAEKLMSQASQELRGDLERFFTMLKATQ